MHAQLAPQMTMSETMFAHRGQPEGEASSYRPWSWRWRAIVKILRPLGTNAERALLLPFSPDGRQRSAQYARA
jgi:hypothetical protein